MDLICVWKTETVICPARTIEPYERDKLRKRIYISADRRGREACIMEIGAKFWD